MRSENDTDLIAAALEGDETAFSRLGERHLRRIFERIAINSASWIDRDDIAQEVLLAAYEKLAQLKNTDRFEAWICRIADNLTRRAVRRGFIQMEFQEAHMCSAQDGAFYSCTSEKADVVIKARLRAALERCTPMQTEVLFHHYIQGRSYRETAQLLDCGTNTVKSRLQKGRDRLRKEYMKMMNTDDRENVIELNRTDLEAFRGVSLARSHDAERAIFNGILLNKDGTVVGCDARRLMINECLPLRSLKESIVIGYVNGDDIPDADSAMLVVGIEDVTLMVEDREIAGFPLLEGSYPNYKAVIPEEWSCSITLGIEEIGNLLSEIKPFLDEKHPEIEGFEYRPQVELLIDAQEQELIARTGRVLGYSAKEGVTESIGEAIPEGAQWEHKAIAQGTVEERAEPEESVKVHVNFAFLTDAVSGMRLGSDRRIQILAESEENPIVIRSIDGCSHLSVICVLKVQEF